MAALPPPLDGQKDLAQVGRLLGVSRGTSPFETDEDFRERLDLIWQQRKHEKSESRKD